MKMTTHWFQKKLQHLKLGLTMVLGVIFGLLAALFQSISYLCTRLFVKRHKNDIVTLLALSHIIMGIISFPLALLLLPEKCPNFQLI